MAKSYNDAILSESIDKVENPKSVEGTCLLTKAKDEVLKLLLERVNNGTNIDYLVKVSEIYRNIK